MGLLAAGALAATLTLAACGTTREETGTTQAAPAGQAAVPAADVAAASGGVSRQATTPAAGVTARSISVSGEGKVKAKPDTATVNVGVSISRPTASEALSVANERATAVIDAVKDAGISADDITTSQVSVSPEWNNSGGPPRSYNASNMLTVTVRDIAKAGPVIDAAAKAAGDGISVSGVSFSISDTSTLFAQARTAAVADAKTTAEQLAAAADVRVGDVLRIDQTGSAVPPPVYYERAAADSAGGAAASTPIEVGTQDVTVSVTVVYAID